jgi:DNA-binding NarL/FixJ family response regulator
VVAGEADCASTALEAVEQLAPDGVLLDVCLPDKDGAFVARRLSTTHPGVAVLLVSADSDGASPELARRSGARGFVSKAELARIDLAVYWPSLEAR